MVSNVGEINTCFHCEMERKNKKLQTLFIFIHGRFAPLFTKEGDRSTKLCSSFNLFSPKTKEKYLFDHCLFHSSEYNWGWGCRWGVRSEDEFLGSYSWVIAYQSILLSRTGRGRLLALMVSHVIFRITETLLTHMRNAEAVWGCIIKSVLMTSLYCSCVSMGASLGQVGEDRFPLIHIHRTGFVKMMRCVFCLKTHSLPILPFSRDSVQFSCSVMSSSLQPYGIQHIRLPCPTPTPRAYSNSCTSSQWCHPTSSSSAITFSSCPQSFPASGSFQMSQLFTSGGQSIGVSASAPVLPMNIQDGLDLLVVQGTLKRLFQHHSSKASICPRLAVFSPTFTSIHDCWKNHRFEFADLCWQSDVSAF